MQIKFLLLSNVRIYTQASKHSIFNADETIYCGNTVG